MLVSCPQCKANYQIDTVIKNAVLVCHRCGAEFTLEKENPSATETTPAEPSLFDIPPRSSKPDTYTLKQATEEQAAEEQATEEQATEEQATEEQATEEQADQAASIEQDNISADTEANTTSQLSDSHGLPQRQQPSTWLWFTLVLLCIAALGAWKQQKQWLEQPWLRSLMMNMQLSIQPNPSDWSIDQATLHSQWIKRQDDSRVLFIDGYIHNRLLSTQTPPAIEISFYDMPHAKPIQTHKLAITEPPSLPSIRHAPYTPPPIDQVPVSAHGKRVFTLIVEDIPEQARELSLQIANP